MPSRILRSLPPIVGALIVILSLARTAGTPLFWPLAIVAAASALAGWLFSAWIGRRKPQTK